MQNKEKLQLRKFIEKLIHYYFGKRGWEIYFTFMSLMGG